VTPDARWRFLSILVQLVVNQNTARAVGL